jgi:uncharacterized protein YycO
MELQPFDLLFVYGKTWIGRCISRLTHSPYSHVAIVRDPLHIVETDWKKPLQNDHLNYRSGDYDVFRYKDVLTTAQQTAMNDFINSMLGARYDLLQVLTNGLYILTGFPIRDSPDRLDCSEMVDRMFASAGIDLVPGALGKVTPADLAKSEYLQKVS